MCFLVLQGRLDGTPDSQISSHICVPTFNSSPPPSSNIVTWDETRRKPLSRLFLPPILLSLPPSCLQSPQSTYTSHCYHFVAQPPLDAFISYCSLDRHYFILLLNLNVAFPRANHGPRLPSGWPDPLSECHPLSWDLYAEAFIFHALFSA